MVQFLRRDLSSDFDITSPSHLPSLVNHTAPTSVLDVLHHQPEEGGSGHSGTVFLDSCWNLDMTNEISARVMIKVLNVPRVNIIVWLTLICTCLQYRSIDCMQTLVTTLQAVECNLCFGHPFVSQNLCQSGQTLLPRAGDAICDRIWENPPYGINAQFAQCAFLVPLVRTFKVQILSYTCQRTFLLTVTVVYGG